MAKRVPVFECLFCERCCYFEDEIEMPTVFPKEKRLLEELAEARGFRVEFEPLLIFRDREGRCAVALYRWVIRGFCPFFDKATKKCTIHSVKPLACKMYPLLLEMPTGRLMASGKCEWVKRMGPRLMERLNRRPELIPRVFPNEFEAARVAFSEIASAMEYASRNGLERVDSLEGCKEVYDLDDYVARFG